MKETLYRPHASDGTHFCESKDQEGWIKGSTLDDESNKVHGTLDLEPVEIDTDNIDPDAMVGVAAIAVVGVACIGVGMLVHAAISNRDQIVAWAKDKIEPIKKRWGKHEKQELSQNDQEESNNIIDFKEYLDKEKEDTSEKAEAVN